MPKYWGTAQGRIPWRETFGQLYAKKPDVELLRVVRRATNERMWELLHRLIVNEWDRLRREKAALFDQGPVPNPPLHRWHVNLEPPAPPPEAALELAPDGDPLRAKWQGAKGLPAAASVLEPQTRRLPPVSRETGWPAINARGEVWDGLGWRAMTPTERRKWGRPATARAKATRRAPEKVEQEDQEDGDDQEDE